MKINDVAKEGYPAGDAVFYFDGCWVSGWPLGRSLETDDDGFLLWEADSTVGRPGATFHGVRYWIAPPKLPREEIDTPNM